MATEWLNPEGSEPFSLMDVHARAHIPLIWNNPSDPSDFGVRRLEIAGRLVDKGMPSWRANAIAQRIAERDIDDDRRTCAECVNYVPDRCRNHRQAGLTGDAIAPAFAELLQRCPGFSEVAP